MVPRFPTAASHSSGETWALATDGVRLYELGREDAGEHFANKASIARLSVIGQDGKRINGKRLQQIYMTNAAVDDDCIYYARVDPAGVTWYSAIPKPAF